LNGARKPELKENSVEKKPWLYVAQHGYAQNDEILSDVSSYFNVHNVVNSQLKSLSSADIF
jgi:hypothetical protein